MYNYSCRNKNNANEPIISKEQIETKDSVAEEMDIQKKMFLDSAENAMKIASMNDTLSPKMSSYDAGDHVLEIYRIQGILSGAIYKNKAVPQKMRNYMFKNLGKLSFVIFSDTNFYYQINIENNLIVSATADHGVIIQKQTPIYDQLQRQINEDLKKLEAEINKTHKVL